MNIQNAMIFEILSIIFKCYMGVHQSLKVSPFCLNLKERTEKCSKQMANVFTEEVAPNIQALQGVLSICCTS